MFVLYASTAVFWAAALARVLVYTTQASAAAAAVSDCDVQALFNPIRTAAFNDRMSCLQTATLTVNILIGDAVVWWRMSLLWPGRSKVVTLALGAALLLATLGHPNAAVSTADTCGACQLELVRHEAGFGQLFSGDRFGAAAAILSLVTNVVATSLTAYKAWVHARLLRQYFSGGTMATNVGRVLVLLVESGSVYALIWVVVSVYQVGVNTGDVYDTSMSTDFWGVLGLLVSGALVPTIAIYPMAILVLVALKKSQMEQTLALSNSDVTLSTDIRLPMPPSSASPSPCPGAGDVPDKEAGSRSEC
ncbi:hypothetical protein C8Q76DRAFT_780169 [Earliella scabrosa]|nr:hypothetical protein C8Q76DRAFT_780169 [Earliella scabrosa]